VRPVCILDGKIKQLHNRIMELVKVQYTWYNIEDATWDFEDAMQEEYPHLFEYFLNFVCICVYNALGTMHK
jgi:hypothetical protein